MRSDSFIICTVMLLIVGAISANPPPMIKPTTIDMSLVQTLEFSLH